MKYVIVSLSIILLISGIVSGFTVRERFGDDVVFIPSTTNTNYTINPDLELSTLTIKNDSLYINGNILQFISENDTYAYVHLGQILRKNLLVLVTETSNKTTAILGGFTPGEKYYADISDVEFITNIADNNGNITFTWVWNETTPDFILIGYRYDVNLDGYVNVFDLSETWANRWENTEYLGRYDVNEDNTINVIDLSAIWSHNGW